jgi:cytochrome c oxidase subunit 3
VTDGQETIVGRTRPRIQASLLGMILFISSEVIFFGSLFGAYFTIRGRAGTWPPEGTPEMSLIAPLIFSAALISSSYTVHRASAAIKRGDRNGLGTWLAATIALGGIFLAGQGWEYSHLVAEGFEMDFNVFATLFFTMTGFHGLHVFGGLVALLIVLAKARRGDFSAERHGGVEAAAYYWHFVDAVWVFLFTVLYVLR